MHSQERFLVLLDKYTHNTISPEEQDELFYLISSGAYDHIIEDHFQANFQSEHIPGADLHPQRAQELMHKILSAEKQTSHMLPGIFRKKKMARWYMAASIAGLIAIATYFLFTVYSNRQTSSQASQLTKNMIEKVNRSGAAMTIMLEDSSVVTLQPGSMLNYPAHFLSDKREVHLDGEAFFDIRKNAGRPFLVYHNNLVTQVLGTSFTIKADKQKKQVEVSVITGKVQVYENKTIGNNHTKNSGVILTPNQKAIYKEEDKQFMATLINDPVPVANNSISAAALAQTFSFEEAPLQKVLPALEKYYGIEIVVENDRIYQCLFTGDISNHGLYTKLDIICESVKATYEIVGTKILIKGKGCNQ
jgi:transmembrane sensor